MDRATKGVAAPWPMIIGSELANWSSTGGNAAFTKMGVPTSEMLRVELKTTVLLLPSEECLV
jgi:hypothetical protein